KTIFFAEDIKNQLIIAFINKTIFVNNTFVFPDRIERTIQMQNSLIRNSIILLQVEINNSFFRKIFFQDIDGVFVGTRSFIIPVILAEAGSDKQKIVPYNHV